MGYEVQQTLEWSRKVSLARIRAARPSTTGGTGLMAERYYVIPLSDKYRRAGITDWLAKPIMVFVCDQLTAGFVTLRFRRLLPVRTDTAQTRKDRSCYVSWAAHSGACDNKAQIVSKSPKDRFQRIRFVRNSYEALNFAVRRYHWLDLSGETVVQARRETATGAASTRRASPRGITKPRSQSRTRTRATAHSLFRCS